MQRRLTGREYTQTRTAFEQVADRGRRRGYVLEVVEHEQEIVVGDPGCQRVQHGLAGRQRRAELGGYFRQDEIRVGENAQLHQRGSPLAEAPICVKYLERDARLAHAPAPGEG